MKSIEEIKRMVLEASREIMPQTAATECVRDAFLEILDHVDRLNGRSDIMAEVAEGNMMIVRRDEYVAKSFYQQLYRELVALRQAVRECEKGIITSASIVPRQASILVRDEEYQSAIRSRIKIDPAISAGDPIVDRNSYNMPDQYDRMDFRELRAALVARGSLYVPAEDTPSQAQEMREWLRHADSVGFNTENPSPNTPHTFILDAQSGLNHTEYRVCKCGLSEFNVMHTREDTNAKTNQTGSQTQGC